MPFHGFKGVRNGLAVKSGNFSQATLRRAVSTYDQHGRAFAFSAEISTGMPCGLVQPEFTAPWMPDPQPEYMMVNPENTSELFINYRAIIADRMRAMKEYHSRAVRKAEKSQWPAPRLGEYSDDILAACGKPPRPYQLAVAAEKGNPWVLGDSAIPDPRLVRFLEVADADVDVALDMSDYGAASYEKAIAGLRGTVRTQRTVTRALRNTEAQEIALAEEARLLAEAEADSAFDGFDDPAREDGAYAEGYDADENAGQTELTDFDDLPTETDAFGHAYSDLEDDELRDTDPQALEDLVDPHATGGKTIHPAQQDRVTRQAARRGATKPKRGKHRSKNFKEGRKSLADGVPPVIAGS